MNLQLSWGELARAAGGVLVSGPPEDRIESISTDTRTLKAGQAFWALKGTRFDAHELLDKAVAAKAGGAVLEAGRVPRGLKIPHLIEVPNTLKALQALSRHHRRRFDIPVVGITGSNGKTTSKEMLKGICRLLGPTCASPGNWNNQVGVPLSILELTSEHHYGIFELADSRPGDIAEIARITEPTLALLTNIGPDHLEFYGSLEANFKTKLEILEALPPDSKVAINLDDPWLASLQPQLGARAVTFGLTARAMISCPSANEIIVDRHRIPLAHRLFGVPNRYNAAAAAAAAWALGISSEFIRKGLESYRPCQMRLEALEHPSGCLVIVDAYNANPASMRASVEAFCEESGARSKILALGDMKELGEASALFHRELGQWLAGLPLEAVYLAGPEMRFCREALSEAGARFTVVYGASSEEWTNSLKAALGPGKALLLKASRAMRFESILESLECSTT